MSINYLNLLKFGLLFVAWLVFVAVSGLSGLPVLVIGFLVGFFGYTIFPMIGHHR